MLEKAIFAENLKQSCKRQKSLVNYDENMLRALEFFSQKFQAIYPHGITEKIATNRFKLGSRFQLVETTESLPQIVGS